MATVHPATARADQPIAYRTICADSHVNPPPTMWAEYLPAKLRQFAPQVEERDDGDYILFEGRARKLNLINAQAGRDHRNFKMEGRQSDQRRGIWLAPERIADMDTDGLDAVVMFGGGPLGTLNSELYHESFKAYNRWLADFCAHDRRRLCPVGYIPMRDVAESIAMLKDCVALGFTAINIPAFPSPREAVVPKNFGFQSSLVSPQAAALTGNPFGERQYDQPEFDPFWQAVVEHGVVLTMHLGGRSVRFEQKDKMLPDMIMSKLAMAEPAAILIYGGVFMRHPGLRLAMVESGSGWMAFAAEYMDRTWEKQRYWLASPLTEPPSHYMDQNVYTSFINDRTAVLLRNQPGARNIMWSSDYPHSETTFPRSHEVIARDFDGVPEADRQMIVCGRARALFRIGA
ncbi:amidohydrolase family protein [Novosphingobium bradum]|uniref:Amidohydrolase family protein n=1 Tax=Novosphingobium bradum TaxID=1737444 RepID=A0ABV7IQ19_9SPHN